MADLNEGRNKQLRVVCELEDKKGNDTGVKVFTLVLVF
jgi:hypothetical protein